MTKFLPAFLLIFSFSLLHTNDAFGQCGTHVPKNVTLEAPEVGSPGYGTGFGLTTWKSIKWEKSTLRVEFLGGSAKHREYVRKQALEWAQRTNISLIFHASYKSDIRISFKTGKDASGQPIGTYSVLGVLAKDKQYIGKPTMNYSQLSRRNVLHEFGHALGFPHEHLRPDLNIKWNKDVVYKYAKENYGWNKQRVNSNIFAPLTLSEMITGQKDVQSIMTYPILPGWTQDSFSIPEITELSNLDISFTNRVYKNYQPKSACNNYLPEILFDEFKKHNLNDIRSWKHHCNNVHSFYAHATDVQGRDIWVMRDHVFNKYYEWAVTHKIYNPVKGAIIYLEPFGKKAKEVYAKYVPEYKYRENHVLVLTQGDAYMKKSYIKDDGTYVSHGQDYMIGQGKFYK